MTHTYAEVAVSKAVFDEVKAILKAAEYEHAFIDDDTIDMHGLGLICGSPQPAEVLPGTPFSLAFNAVQRAVHRNAREKGFWDGKTLDIPGVGLTLALIHSEISEALEAAREDYPASKKIPEIGNFEEELADAVIRLMDLSGAMGLNLGEAVLKKMTYNTSRPRMHGKKA